MGGLGVLAAWASSSAWRLRRGPSIDLAHLLLAARGGGGGGGRRWGAAVIRERRLLQLGGQPFLSSGRRRHDLDQRQRAVATPCDTATMLRRVGMSVWAKRVRAVPVPSGQRSGALVGTCCSDRPQALCEGRARIRQSFRISVGSMRGGATRHAPHNSGSSLPSIVLQCRPGRAHPARRAAPRAVSRDQAAAWRTEIEAGERIKYEYDLLTDEQVCAGAAGAGGVAPRERGHHCSGIACHAQVDDIVDAAAGFISVIDDLRPLDRSSWNPAFEIWQAIAAIPPSERWRLLDELEPGGRPPHPAVPALPGARGHHARQPAAAAQLPPCVTHMARSCSTCRPFNAHTGCRRLAQPVEGQHVALRAGRRSQHGHVCWAHRVG